MRRPGVMGARGGCGHISPELSTLRLYRQVSSLLVSAVMPSFFLHFHGFLIYLDDPGSFFKIYAGFYLLQEAFPDS